MAFETRTPTREKKCVLTASSVSMRTVAETFELPCHAPTTHPRNELLVLVGSWSISERSPFPAYSVVRF